MFFKNIHVRIKIITGIIFFLFALIIGKVFYIQVFSYEKLNNYATSLWSRNLPIEANRGKIYDCNGIVLADNVTTTSLVLIPNQITDKEKTAELIAPILGISYEDMYEHVSKKTSIERVHPEGRRLDYETADQISELELPGVYLLKESKRYYPYGELLSHTLGFVGIDNQGLSGLELIYDEYLTGSYGAIKYFSDAKGNKLQLSEIYEQPQDGINIYLTIDYNIQIALERELDNAISKYNPDQALGIVMNPKTGEILAMASRPAFDPSNYEDYSTEIINRNLPIWMTYEPGSTFKIITLATALEENLVNLEEEHFYDGGAVTVGGATIHCWKHGGHGDQTFLQVVENSCNLGVYTRTLISLFIKTDFHDGYEFFLNDFKKLFLANPVYNIRFFAKYGEEYEGIQKANKFLKNKKLIDSKDLIKIEKFFIDVINNRKDNLFNCFIPHSEIKNRDYDFYMHQLDWVLRDYYKKTEGIFKD